MEVAYSGVKGAFAYVAATKIFPNVEPKAFYGFREAYESVEKGESDFAVLPIENSFAGEVGQVMDLLFNGSLFVNGVFTLHISQNLLGVKGATIADVKKVISHPQGLEQCMEYIEAHGFETEHDINTAIAAKRVAKAGDKSIAAIASKETAALYGLDILQADINESDDNTTRFVVVSKNENSDVNLAGNNIVMLMFSVKNETGSLAKVINVIGASGYNMRTLRSRPMKKLPWQYYFYAELEGDVSSEIGKHMIGLLENNCEVVKLIGYYRGDEELNIL